MKRLEYAEGVPIKCKSCRYSVKGTKAFCVIYIIKPYKHAQNCALYALYAKYEEN